MTRAPGPIRRSVALLAAGALALPGPLARAADAAAPAPDLRAVVPGTPAPDPDPLALRIRSLRSRRNWSVGLMLGGTAGFTLASLLVLGPLAKSQACPYDPNNWPNLPQRCEPSEPPKAAGVLMIASAAAAVTGFVLYLTTRALPAEQERWAAEHPGQTLDPPEPPAPAAVRPAGPYDPVRPP